MGDIRSVQHFQQVLDNVSGDGWLTDAEKTAANALATTQHDRLSNNLEHDADTWETARENNRAGLNVPPPTYTPSDPDEALGNVWALNSFKNAIVDQLHYSFAEADRLVGLALAFGRRPLSRDEQADLVDMRERVRLRGVEVWVFENETDRLNPFGGANLPDLPCALGLPYRNGEAFVAFEVPAASVGNARRPCTYDASWFFHEFWRPGGRTKPVCTTPGGTGYSEWISAPPLLSELRENILDGLVGDCLAAGSNAYG